eukprot:357322-Chlamydomonas_euryale.AAC.7
MVFGDTEVSSMVLPCLFPSLVPSLVLPFLRKLRRLESACLLGHENQLHWQQVASCRASSRRCDMSLSRLGWRAHRPSRSRQGQGDQAPQRRKGGCGEGHSTWFSLGFGDKDLEMSGTEVGLACMEAGSKPLKRL